MSIIQRDFSEEKFLVFQVGILHYGTPLLDVREVTELAGFQSVPDCEDCYLGVGDIRRRVVGIVDLGVLSGVRKTPTNKGCLLVFEVKPGPLALLVDQLYGVIPFEKDQWIAGPEFKPKRFAAHILGRQTNDGNLIDIIDFKSFIEKRDFSSNNKRKAG